MNEDQFGTANAYTRAFRALENEGIPDNHIALLQAHFNSPAHTTTWARLARAVGYAKGSAVHLQYGKLAGRVARHLGVVVRPNGFWIFVLADWAAERDTSGHTAFVLRRPVIEALTRLGILPSDGNSQRSNLKRISSWESVEEDLEQKVQEARVLSPEERRKRLATLPKYPEKISVSTTAFLRNQYVIAEVLTRAKGVCESCHAPALFARVSDGTPYIEVHHRIRLADGGEDTVENALALCPNCHRKAHYG